MKDNKIKIVDLYSNGLRSKEIGQKLGISSRTVEKHMEILKREKGCKTVAHLIATHVKEKLAGGWINVADELPDYDVLVLWYPVTGNVFTAALDRDGYPYWVEFCLFWRYVPPPVVDGKSEQYLKADEAYERYQKSLRDNF